MSRLRKAHPARAGGPMMTSEDRFYSNCASCGQEVVLSELLNGTFPGGRSRFWVHTAPKSNPCVDPKVVAPMEDWYIYV